MTVEAATYISQLNPALPAAGDSKSEGDDHLRLGKSVLQAQFPNFTAAPVSATVADLSAVTGAGTTGATAFKVATQLTSDSSTLAASTALVDAKVALQAFSTALPSQTGNSGKVPTTDGTTASWTAVKTLNGASLLGAGDISLIDTTGFRNRVINGSMVVDQRNAGAAQTITAAAALAYTVDRWYAYCTGANVTGQQVAGSSQTQKRYQFTGAASVTAIGFGTRMEARDTYDLNGTTVTIAADLANSLLTTVTWTLYRATTSDDTFGTLASPTVTQVATGTWTVNSTVTRYSAQAAVTAASTTGLQLVLSVGAQISGTWTIGNVQLEPGSTATAFEQIPYQVQLARCQRYYYKTFAVGFVASMVTSNYLQAVIKFPVTMRTAPTVLEQSGVTANYTVFVAAVSTASSGVPTFSFATKDEGIANIFVASGHTAGQAGTLGGGGYFGWPADL